MLNFVRIRRLSHLAVPILVAGAAVPLVVERGTAQSVEDRIAALEARVAELETRLLLQGRPTVTPIRAALVFDAEGPIVARLVEKRFSDGRVQDYIRFRFEFVSTLGKPVRSFTGVVVFKDPFEREVLRYDITSDRMMAPGETVLWSGGLGFDPTMDAHLLLRGMGQDELRIEFELESVTYTSGLREFFSTP